MRAATVIGVAGPVGAGKSALASALADRLAASCIVSFDAYEQMTERPVDDVRRWLASGAPAEEVPVPGLERDLERLKHGEAPDFPTVRHVLFETQFGRLHSPTGRLIDFLVWIDTPLDIALARKVRQLCASANASPAFLGWLSGYLDNYLGLVGDLLRLQRDRVMPSADLVLDGRESVPVQADRVLKALAEQRL